MKNSINLIFFLLATIIAKAQVSGHWTYLVENGGATITRSTATGQVAIPEILNGYPVVKVGIQYNPIFATPSNVVSISFPFSVTDISSNAFQGCNNLTSITIPNTIKNVGWATFDGCTKLATVTLENGIAGVWNGAFINCSGLTSVNLPASIINIGGNAFQNCTSLLTISIPDSVKTIGWNAFKGCSSLTTVGLPSNLLYLGNNAFQDCGKLTNITLPNTLRDIGDFAFHNCLNLNNLNTPNKLKTIGVSAFQNCSSLRKFTIPISIPAVGDPEIFTTISNSAFKDCVSLGDITLPPNVTTIGISSYQGCSSLTTLTIPNSVTYIGNSAFLDCVNLASLNIPIVYIASLNLIGFKTQVASKAMVEAIADALSSNATFIRNLSQSILTSNGNYGIATQTGVNTLLTSTIASLATKGELTTIVNEGKTAGIASVISAPNTWSLFTASQIHNMAIGDLILSRQQDGRFILNYNIEQSDDLVNWTVYTPMSMPLNILPIDKLFVRIKAK